FILKLNQNGSKLIYSTYIGGNDRDIGNALVIDSSGNAHITGRTTSLDFPTTPVAYDNSCNLTDVFMLKLAPNGSMLIYSTFIGGNSVDYGFGIALDSIGNVFITGETQSPDFPTTPGAYDRWHNDNITSDVFVLKFYFESKIINITSLSLVKDNESTNLIYSRLCPYTFRVNFIYSANLSDLSSVRLTLDPLGSNIKLLWDYSTGQFSKFSDPNNYISLETTSKVHNYFYWWTIDFNVTFNWTYPDEKFNDVQVYASSTVLPPAWLNVTNLYQVENDLIFNGTLLVKGEDNRTIYEDTLVRGGEILEWTGLTPIYENTTDVYPLADEFDVVVWDEVGSSWIDSPTSGQQFYVKTDTINTTYNTSFTYTIKLSNIPPESDRTDERFTIMISRIPEEADKTNKTFDVFIDADNVTFSNVIPANNTWRTNRNVLVSVNITDIGGGVVNSKSVMYMYSTNNGETWNEWKLVPGINSDVSIIAKDSISLLEGKNNLIKWQAADSVGNGPTESESISNIS
ncbi:MAG: SBBP repeat-containing protein, partial [Thermoplasmata archaeon]|nr:SBBP repeat-containing protein [Thermoplasmata archaeon]